MILLNDLFKQEFMKELKTDSGKPVSVVGLGTFPLQGETMAATIIKAVEFGYNLIDTADDYRGETGIGLAVAKGVFKRDDVFLQTKISNDTAWADEPLAGKFFNNYTTVMKRHTVDEIVREKVRVSLREMNTDYLDSVLIHYPYPDFYEEIWQTLVALQKEGLIRYIGCSNFHIRHIEKLKNCSGVAPIINEIYISPIGTKEEDVKYSKENDIQLMTYSPLMDIRLKKIPEGELKPLMEKYGKSLSQIILRWNIDRGCIPLAKSQNPKRLLENISIMDFQLTLEEVALISSLNRNNQILPETKICPGL